MPDDRPLSMPVSAPLVGDQGKGREVYAKRKRKEKERPGFAAEGADDGGEDEDEYAPSAIERPDPNQPLYEALDRMRAVEHPPEPDTGRRAKAVKAYQEQTTRSVNR